MSSAPRSEQHSPSKRLRRRASAGAITLAVLSGATTIPSALALSTSGATIPSTDSGIFRTSAYDLIDSIGVGVHTAYTDTSYANVDRVVNLVQQLGVRNVRDGMNVNNPAQVQALEQLGESGEVLNLLTGPVSANGPSVDANQMSELATLAPYLGSIEDPNEYDCSNDPSWTTDLRNYDDKLVAAVRSSSTLADVPILGPSFCRPESVADYGATGISADVDNVHDYSNGEAPEMSLESRIPAFQQTIGQSKPLYITETGYHNAMNAAEGQPAVTEATAADYDVRTVLDALRIGVRKTFLYELMDEKSNPAMDEPEQHFGLVRSDGSVKPAFTAIQNLLSDVSDGSPGGVTPSDETSAGVPLTLQGGGALLRSMIVSGSPATGETLALWTATPLKDSEAHGTVTDRSHTITITSSSPMTGASQQPSRGNGLTQLGTSDTFQVPVNGAVTLVHLATPVAQSASDTSPLSCTTGSSYVELASTLGAVKTDNLDPSDAWSGSTSDDTSVPDGVGAGSAVTNGAALHVDIAATPAPWTISIWEKTDPSSASYAYFLHSTNAQDTLMRTYDLASDPASHDQLSGYGPPAASGNGNEMWGQAVLGTWHLLSLTSTGTTASFAVDGVPVGTAASSSSSVSGVDVGGLSSGFRGSLAGLAVFPTALSSDQLSDLATTEATVPCSVSATTSSAPSPTSSPSPTDVPPQTAEPTESSTPTATSTDSSAEPSASAVPSTAAPTSGTSTEPTSSPSPTVTPPAQSSPAPAPSLPASGPAHRPPKITVRLFISAARRVPPSRIFTVRGRARNLHSDSGREHVTLWTRRNGMPWRAKHVAVERSGLLRLRMRTRRTVFLRLSVLATATHEAARSRTVKVAVIGR